MNWLALKALKERYTAQPGPQRERSKEIYDDLRKNVVDNVFKASLIFRAPIHLCFRLILTQEWKRTGYSWEQYDAETGEGRRR